MDVGRSKRRCLATDRGEDVVVVGPPGTDRTLLPCFNAKDEAQEDVQASN